MGCAIGTMCALSYANIFISDFEVKHICSYIKDMSLLYLRCNDDTYMIWKGTESELMAFMKELNEKHKTM